MDANLSVATVQPATLDGIILISSSMAHVLFDTGTSHSFISEHFAHILGLGIESLDIPVSVNSPLRKLNISTMCNDCDVIIENENLKVSMIVIPMLSFDVILGIDWMSEHNTILDCQRRRVILTPREGVQLVYHLDGAPVQVESIIRHV